MLYALIHVKWLLHRLLFSEILQTRFQNPFTVFVWSAPPLFHFYFRPFRCRTELKRGESNLGLTQVTTCPYLFSLPIISVPQQLCRLASKFVFRERNIMNGKRFGVPHPIYLSSVQKRGVASRSTDKFIVASHRNRCPHANTRRTQRTNGIRNNWNRNTVTQISSRRCDTVWIRRRSINSETAKIMERSKNKKKKIKTMLARGTVSDLHVVRLFNVSISRCNRWRNWASWAGDRHTMVRRSCWTSATSRVARWNVRVAGGSTNRLR